MLTVAQLAGIMGAKHTAALIPLCHNIFLSKVQPPAVAHAALACCGTRLSCLQRHTPH